MFPNVSLNGTTPLVIAVVVGLFLAILWVFQFAHLMALDESDFPGRFTRLGWVAAFVVLWALAPFAFLLWCARRRPARPRRDRTERTQ
mgnify:CR=1 FL=1